MALTIPEVLYNNSLRNYATAPTYDGPEVEGLEYINAFDWLDWTLFQTEANTESILMWEARTASYIDGAGIYIVPFDTDYLTDEAVIGLSLIGQAIISQPTGSCTIFLEYASSPTGPWTAAASQVFSGTTSLAYLSFNPVNTSTYNWWRFRIVNAANSQVFIRQLVAGPIQYMAQGQHVDQVRPSVPDAIILSNPITVNGSMLTRQSRRTEKAAELIQSPVNASFVDNEWAAFVRHARAFPFFFMWNKAQYPEQVCYAAATDFPAARNVNPPPWCEVRMPLRLITE